MKKDLEKLKQRILGEINRIAAESDGIPPGRVKFGKLTGIKVSEWEGKIWTSWSDAIEEAGFKPNILTPPTPKDDLFRCLAELTREKGGFPSIGEIGFAHFNKPNFPPYDSFRKRIGKKDDQVESLINWVKDKPEYSDVAQILSSALRHHKKRAPLQAKTFTVRSEPFKLSDSYIPPVIECLPMLAGAHSDIVKQCNDNGLDENVEFEKRVANAFRILGLFVEEFGQGQGRVADGIAKCLEKSWAIVYDTKVRRGGYSMGTEDRKFREYIENHTPELKRQGISKVYFAVISSSFTPEDLYKAMEITRLTEAKSVVFLEANALLKIVEKRLRQPLNFGLDNIERIFVKTRIVESKDV